MSPDNWNPHLKLEYLKMCIRTILEKAQADRKKKEKSDEDLLNIELDLAIKSLEKDNVTEHQKAELVELVEDLRIQKEVLVEEKGQRLAEKLGTKWYNEGEKSTRYFLRILRRSSPDRFKELTGENGDILKDEKAIEEEIVTYYKNLYENYDKSNLIDDDDNFFDELTNISVTDRGDATKPVTDEELWKTLQTCQDSAPGPDGITYGIW